MVKTSRRSFLGGSVALAAVPVLATEDKEADVVQPADPFEGTKGAPFTVGEPCLQAPAATTMGVSWFVSGLSKGVVEVADNPQLENARTFRSGGFGLVPIDVAALQVRLEGLKPSTRYWYRTVTTPFTDYANVYDAKLGEPVVSAVHSFTTLGEAAPAHFCVINDTHAKWPAFDLMTKKVKSLKPTALVWNGDATNTTQHKETAVEIFLNPQVETKDYSSDVPVFFESGNHDFRGSWISRKEEVVLPRHPAERTGSEWNLKWNFAERLGDLALIGLDTGEDKPDAHPKWFGLANFSPYRQAQAAWLEKALSRPDIAAAKFKVVFCHIPLFMPADHHRYPHDGSQIDPHDYARWSRECHDLWAPILERHGVRLVICAHQHEYQSYAPEGKRTWHELIGGGCDLNDPKGIPGRVPTVIEGKVVDGKLVVVTYDVEHDCTLGKIEFV